MKQSLLQAVGLAATADIPLRDILTPDWARLGLAGLKPSRKNSRILAALAEIIRTGDESDPRGLALTEAAKVAEMFRGKVRHLDNEHLWVLTHDRKLKVIACHEMSSGGEESCAFDVKEIIRRTLFDRAYGIILVHNHPSGCPRPSTTDIKQTEKLRDALETFDAHLTDHVVVARDSYYSFTDEMTEKYRN